MSPLKLNFSKRSVFVTSAFTVASSIFLGGCKVDLKVDPPPPPQTSYTFTDAQTTNGVDINIENCVEGQEIRCEADGDIFSHTTRGLITSFVLPGVGRCAYTRSAFLNIPIQCFGGSYEYVIVSVQCLDDTTGDSFRLLSSSPIQFNCF